MKKWMAVGLIVMSLGLAACGDSTTPKDTVETYFAAIQKADFEAMKKLNETGTADDFTFDSTVKEEQEQFKLLFSKMSVEVGEEKIEGDKATVETKVTAIDMGKLVEEIMKDSIANQFAQAGQQKSDAEMDLAINAKLDSMLKDPKAPTNVTEATVNLVKKDDKWVIADANDEMANAVLGNIQDAFK